MLFFFNDTATTEIYPLSLHDALPIFAFGTPMVLVPFGAAADAHQLANARAVAEAGAAAVIQESELDGDRVTSIVDRKSTRLNSSHVRISYAVFCLKKKKVTECSSPIL